MLAARTTNAVNWASHSRALTPAASRIRLIFVELHSAPKVIAAHSTASSQHMKTLSTMLTTHLRLEHTNRYLLTDAGLPLKTDARPPLQPPGDREHLSDYKCDHFVLAWSTRHPLWPGAAVNPGQPQGLI